MFEEWLGSGGRSWGRVSVTEVLALPNDVATSIDLCKAFPNSWISPSSDPPLSPYAQLGALGSNPNSLITASLLR